MCIVQKKSATNILSLMEDEFSQLFLSHVLLISPLNFFLSHVLY